LKTRGRKRKGDVDYGIGLLPFPNFESDVTKFIKDMNKGVIFTSERDALNKGVSFRGGSGTRDVKALKDLQNEINKAIGGVGSKDLAKSLDVLGFGLGTATESQTDIMQSTKTTTAQVQEFQQALRQQFGQMTALRNDIPTIPKTIEVPGFVPPFGDEPRRKRKKGKAGKVKRGEKKLKAKDILELSYGKGFAKRFNKAFGLKGDPYGAF
jgi:hypothetical protein